jgi:hypothetical protein
MTCLLLYVLQCSDHHHFTSFSNTESSFGTSTWYRFWTSTSLNHFQSNSSVLHFTRCSLAYWTHSSPQYSVECRSQLYRRITHQWHLNLRCLKTWSICLPIRSSSVFVYTLWCGNIVIFVIPLLEVENLQLSHHQRHIRRNIPAKPPVWKVLSLSPCFNILWSGHAVLAELIKYLLSPMNLSSVFSIHPSFRNAHSKQYLQTSDILIHDTRLLTNPTLLAKDMVPFCTKHNIADCHVDSCRRMRIVWRSSASLLHLTSGAFICILLVFFNLFQVETLTS